MMMNFKKNDNLKYFTFKMVIIIRKEMSRLLSGARKKAAETPAAAEEPEKTGCGGKCGGCTIGDGCEAAYKIDPAEYKKQWERELERELANKLELANELELAKQSRSSVKTRSKKQYWCVNAECKRTAARCGWCGCCCPLNKGGVGNCRLGCDDNSSNH